MEKENKLFRLKRRDFIKIGALATGGLILGIPIACKNDDKFLTGKTDERFSFNVYMHLRSDGIVDLIAHRSEMGTGIRTTLPLVMADELEADWKKVRIIQAKGHPKYGDQNTDGSYSVRMFYNQMRIAGASLRKMLVSAAAKHWKCEENECEAKEHLVTHKSGKSLGYGYLADKLKDIEIPGEGQINLKVASEFKYISKKTKIYDAEDLVTGKSKFGYDINPDGAKVAVILRNPEAGAGIESFDDKEALAVKGVERIYEMKGPGFPTGFDKPMGGIVIVAKNTWAALKAQSLIKVKWKKGINSDYDSEKFIEELKKKLPEKGVDRRNEGDYYSSVKKAVKTVDAFYENPHYSHAPMETPAAVANYTEGKGCEVWAPVQSPQWARSAVANALEIEEDNVIMNITFLGGGFGRKSKPDFVVEAALISKEISSAVKLLWTRENDIQHDFYHFNGVQYLKAGIDRNNKLTSWLHRSIMPPIGGTSSTDNKLAPAGTLSQGAIDLPFDIENISVETNEAEAKIRIGWLRSVGNVNHGFAIGSFVDRIAEARKMDPFDNIIDLIGDDRNVDYSSMGENFSNYGESLDDFPFNTTRFKNTIAHLRKESDWDNKVRNGKYIGFAAHRSFLTYVACTVELVKEKNGRLRVDEVHYSVDCGVAVNPDRIKAQFEGGAIFALSLARNHISVKNGAVEQNNFNDYPIVRMGLAPEKIFVHIVESQEKPTGVGEPPVPPFLGALGNAVYKASGKRVEKLPIKELL